MKKFTIYLLSICTGLSCALFSVKTQALDNIETEEVSMVSDEYTMLLDELRNYETKGQSILMMNEAEAERYTELKNAIENYQNFIYEQQKLSEEELKAQYYTDQQIAAIRAFDGDENLLPLASATVSGTLSVTEFNYNSTSNRTYLAIKLKGSWSGTPAIRSQDTVALRVNGTSSNYIEVSSTGKVTFDNGITLNDLNTRGETNGRLYKFGMQYNGSTIRSFEFTYRGFGDGRMTGSSYAAAYAHSTINTSVGFGINFAGTDISGYGISFGIETFYTEMYYDFKNISSYI